MKTICYLRVSTDKQDLKGQKLEIQTYAKKHDLEIDEYIEIEISSRKNGHERKIDELLSRLRRNDILIISEISRIARSIRQTHNFMHQLSRKRIELHAIKEGIVTKGFDDLQTKILLNCFGLCAEIEKNLISQRTRAGLKLAKQRGKVLGNPNLAAVNKRSTEAANKFAESLRTVVTGLVNEGLTQRQIVDSLNEVGIKTRQDIGNWKLIMVQNLLKRLNLKTQHTK